MDSSTTEGIVYSAVAKSGCILVSSHRAMDGSDFETQLNSFLPNIPVERNTKSGIVSGIFTFHILVEDLLIYVCVAETDFGKNVPFAFLREVKVRFTNGSLAIRALTAAEHEFDRDFSYILKDQMTKFSVDAPALDGVGRVQRQVREVVSVMNDNISKVVDRGEKLETLVDKTTDLELSSNRFHTTAKKVRRHFWCKNFKMWIVLTAIALAVVTLIVLLATNVIPVRSL